MMIRELASEHEADLAAPDAPVRLAGLLSPEEQGTLERAAHDLSCGVGLVDAEGRVVLGSVPAWVTAQAAPEAEPVLVSGPDGARYLCAAVFHDGDRLALVACGPVAPGGDAVARYLCGLSDVLLSGALRRTLAARLHVASVEEAYCELQTKNQRLEQALQRMHELDRIKSSFLATVSHELRTPLTSVLGYSEMLMEGLAGPLNDEQRDYLRTVMEKGEQLLGLITGILDISRIEASGVKLKLVPLDLREILRDVYETVAPQARRKRLDVLIDAPAGPVAVIGDRDKLRQVVLNLLGNAIKFTPEAGQVRIGLRLQEPEAVYLQVADTGIGIPEALHEKVFDPFYQVDNSSTRQYEGTGLGLAIVRRFVEAHGGRVWISSAAPRGAIFHLMLPQRARPPESAAPPAPAP